MPCPLSSISYRGGCYRPNLKSSKQVVHFQGYLLKVQIYQPFSRAGCVLPWHTNRIFVIGGAGFQPLPKCLQVMDWRETWQDSVLLRGGGPSGSAPAGRGWYRWQSSFARAYRRWGSMTVILGRLAAVVFVCTISFLTSFHCLALRRSQYFRHQFHWFLLL